MNRSRNLIHYLLAACTLLFAANRAPAQAPEPDKLPRFEVATIKPVEPGVMHLVGTKVYPGGRVVITTADLKSLICTAFGIDWWQVSGGDEWVAKEQFDLEAKPAQTTPPTDFSLRFSNFTIGDERLRQMLQAILIDRFQLKFHRETTTGDIFLLEKSSKPILFKPTTLKYAGNPSGPGYSEVTGGGDRWFLYNATMPDLAKFASQNILRRPVLDKTGLDGAFDYRWNMLSASPDAEPPDNHDSFKLFIEAIGLRLAPSTGPVETFVIDHAERPGPN